MDDVEIPHSDDTEPEWPDEWVPATDHEDE